MSRWPYTHTQTQEARRTTGDGIVCHARTNSFGPILPHAHVGDGDIHTARGLGRTRPPGIYTRIYATWDSKGATDDDRLRAGESGRKSCFFFFFCLGDKSIHDYVRTWHVFLLGPIAAAYRRASVDAPLGQDSPSRRMHRVRSKLLQALLTFFLYPITTMSNVQQAKNHANQAANNANQAANQAVNNANQAVNKAANKAEKVSKYVSCRL